MISIIIPIFNAKRHLEKCLKSICSQTYTDFECILVDDGSTDGSGELCDQWAKKESRFRVIHKQNEGVSAARNDGLDIAKGELVMFVDSDDWLENDYVEEMANHCDNAELTVSGQIRDYSNGNQKVFKPCQTTSFTISSENTAIFTQLCKDWLLYAPHEKLYRRDIIEKNGIRFIKGCSYGEDLTFNFEYLNHVRSISMVSEALYHYRIEEGSLSTRFRPNQFDEDYKQWVILESFFQKRGLWNEESKPYLYKRLWGIVYDGIFLYPQLNNASSSYIKKILAIPEIEGLKHYRNTFKCALWIKWLVLNKKAKILNYYFKLTQQKSHFRYFSKKNDFSQNKASKKLD